MLRFIAFLCLLISYALVLPHAEAAPEDPFLSEQLTPADARLLQAALSMSGHYNGLIDGAWGGRSARALIAATRARPTEADALEAILPFINDTDSNWAALNAEGASLLVPMAILYREDAASDQYLSYATPSRDLILRVFFGDAGAASDMHLWLKSNTVADGYSADTPAAYITSGRLADGDMVYLWTRNLDGIFVTALVQWGPQQAGRARLMVASLSAGYVSELSIVPNGYIARMVSDLDASLESSRSPTPPPARSDGSSSLSEPGSVIGTGTGFYVSPTTIVTAAHVVEGCGTLRLADGSAVAMLATNRDLDLAVLLRVGAAGDGGEPDWLDLAVNDARLGSSVTVVGYPYSGLFEQGVTATGGNVSALRGLAGSTDEMLLSAPVQPGNSGGPLLDRTGRVLGVVTARASEAYVRQRSGSAPENMNVATRLVPLRAFLNGAGVTLPPAKIEVPDVEALADGLPDAVVRAVVQLRCLQ